jgi:hypothetical protein
MRHCATYFEINALKEARRCSREAKWREHYSKMQKIRLKQTGLPIPSGSLRMKLLRPNAVVIN